MAPRLPIKKRWIGTDKSGRTCVIEVSVEQTTRTSLYPPDGIKSVFKIKREGTPGAEDFEVVVLIDNHEPFGFHEHPKLPVKHSYRKSIHVSDWKSAWIEFEKRIEEILNES